MAEDKKPEEEERQPKTKFVDMADKSIEDTLSKIQEGIAKFDTSKLETKIDEIGKKVDGFETRIKALETPTDLPLKPATTDDEDIGAKVKVPDTYQSNSQQASIRDSDPKNDRPADGSGLEMQEKAITSVEKSTRVKNVEYSTETPRPNVSLESVEKSKQGDFSPILKAARDGGYDGLSQVARDILSGKFYRPNPDEVATW